MGQKLQECNDAHKIFDYLNMIYIKWIIYKATFMGFKQLQEIEEFATHHVDNLSQKVAAYLKFVCSVCYEGWI